MFHIVETVYKVNAFKPFQIAISLRCIERMGCGKLAYYGDNVFYLVFKLMGQFTQVEVQSARGRADAVVKTPQYIYVFEFKLHDTAEAALKQIDEKDYLIPYQADGREVIKLGVEFSAEKRNINRWLTVMS